MNPIGLRTLIHKDLNAQADTQGRDILTVEPIPPVPGEPVRLRVQAPDPRARAAPDREHPPASVAPRSMWTGAPAPTVPGSPGCWLLPVSPSGTWTVRTARRGG